MVAVIKNKKNEEIKRIENPSKEWIIKQLESHVCVVFFRKKLTGTFRTLKCTRNLSKLPKRYRLKYQLSIENAHGYDDIIPVWETLSRDWKSFDISTVYFFTVLLGEP